MFIAHLDLVVWICAREFSTGYTFPYQSILIKNNMYNTVVKSEATIPRTSEFMDLHFDVFVSFHSFWWLPHITIMPQLLEVEEQSSNPTCNKL